MNDGIVKKFFQGHEFIKVGVPFGGIVHAVSPFILFDRIDLFQQGDMHPIVNFSDAFIIKDSALEACAERVDPIEGSRDRIQYPCKPFG